MQVWLVDRCAGDDALATTLVLVELVDKVDSRISHNFGDIIVANAIIIQVSKEDSAFYEEMKCLQHGLVTI